MESDEELMRRLARGDERALEPLVDRHAGRLHGFLARLGGDRSEAEDLLQETWIRIVRSARSFDPARSFRPWAFRIAANLARDRQRRRSARPTVPLAVDPPDVPADPLTAIDVRERLGRLPARLREVILLRYYEGMSEAEIAQVLSIPRGTVKSRAHHALAWLRGDDEGSE